MTTRQLNPRANPTAHPETAPPPDCGERPPPHLTPAEAAIWTAAERAKRLGDRMSYWRLRRALLLCQATRYKVEEP